MNYATKKELSHADLNHLFGYIRYFKCFFSPCLGVFFGNILTSTSKEPAVADLALTSWVQTIVSKVGEGRHELRPLELFLQTLNHYARISLQQKFPSFRSQAHTQLDSPSSLPIDMQVSGAKQGTSYTGLPGPLVTDSLHKDEVEFLNGHGIAISDLYKEPYQTILALQKSILTEPDPHRQWWSFGS
jgi:hypothetical protein